MPADNLEVGRVTDVFTLTKRLWNAARKSYRNDGVVTDSVVTVGKKRNHQVPLMCIDIHTPDDLVSKVLPKKKDGLRGVGLVAECAFLDGALIFNPYHDGPEAHVPRVLMVLCQWEDGLCCGLMSSVVHYSSEGRHTVSFGRTSSVSHEDVLKRLKMPFPAGAVKVGEC